MEYIWEVYEYLYWVNKMCFVKLSEMVTHIEMKERWTCVQNSHILVWILNIMMFVNNSLASMSEVIVNECSVFYPPTSPQSLVQCQSLSSLWSFHKHSSCAVAALLYYRLKWHKPNISNTPSDWSLVCIRAMEWPHLNPSTFNQSLHVDVA